MFWERGTGEQGWDWEHWLGSGVFAAVMYHRALCAVCVRAWGVLCRQVRQQCLGEVSDLDALQLFVP